ncbi:hypothetical protein JTB14_015861 [Gonioctena quinquepunctata]|nr:hypothetical protein JTB14_015861 [Gonioctena quinquepunctata]
MRRLLSNEKPLKPTSVSQRKHKTENTLLQVVAIFLNLAKPRAEYIQALLQPTQQLNLYEEEKIDKSNQLPLRNISDTQTNQVNNTPQTSVTTRKAVKPKETRKDPGGCEVDCPVVRLKYPPWGFIKVVIEKRVRNSIVLVIIINTTHNECN